MSLMILGILLWVLPHSFKRLAPHRHLMLMPQIKAIDAALILTGTALMVIGYRSVEVTPDDNLYTPLPGMGHLNNLLMLFAIYLFGVGGSRSILIDKMRHPMLTGMLLWAVSHLLVNGDYVSVILFGSLGLWAVAEMVMINRAGPWKKPKPGSFKGDLKNLIGTLAIYGLIVWLHGMILGHSLFLGTYP